MEHKIRNALTVDVEEYFHAQTFAGVVGPADWGRLPSRVVPSTRALLDALEGFGVRATFFVLGWVAGRQPHLVREIARRGHELACHGHLHRPIYAMQPEGFRTDVQRAKAAIEDAAGVAVSGYRAPTFSLVRDTWWALEILADEGFRYDSSIFPIHHDRYGIPDAPRFPHRIRLRDGREMAEFPMTTLRLAGQRLPFSGGGYLRLLPYGVVRAALRRVNDRERMPGMVYVHPWEVDPAQPRLPVSGISRFRHYVNLDSTATKIARLAGEFAFAPVVEVLDALGLAEVAA
jgi:polysaccharide deacetylase family protein (PEP-CTERM system associated)